MADSRSFVVDGLVNARDLGGLPLVGGGVTPAGVFYRSESADRITGEGWEQLRAAGIRSIVDLRAPAERARDANGRPDWLTTLTVDLDGPANREFWVYYEESGLDGTPLYYLPHLEAMPERIGAVLTALAEAPEGGVLFHCMSGRDRTGLTAMVLLSLVGVLPEAIVDDYLETHRKDGFGWTTDANHDLIPVDDLLDTYGTTAEQAFEQVLRSLDAPQLAERAGLRADTLRILRTWRGRLGSPPEETLR